MKTYQVVYRKGGTGAMACEPTRCGSKEQAERVARDYNEANRDGTWDAVNAWVEVSGLSNAA